MNTLIVLFKLLAWLNSHLYGVYRTWSHMLLTKSQLKFNYRLWKSWTDASLNFFKKVFPVFRCTVAGISLHLKRSVLTRCGQDSRVIENCFTSSEVFSQGDHIYLPSVNPSLGLLLLNSSWGSTCSGQPIFCCWWWILINSLHFCQKGMHLSLDNLLTKVFEWGHTVLGLPQGASQPSSVLHVVKPSIWKKNKTKAFIEIKICLNPLNIQPTYLFNAVKWWMHFVFSLGQCRYP